MAKSLSLTIGLRFLLAKTSNKFISFISLSSMLGIAVGIFVLTIILSAMNGFERELTTRLLSVIPHGEITAVKPPLVNWQPLIEQAKQNPNVVSAAPFVNINALIMHGSDLKGVALSGVLPEFEQRTSAVRQFINDDAWEKLEQANGSMVLGQGIVKDLGLNIGDRVYFMLPQPSKNGKIAAPKSTSFTLVGTFKFGGQIDYSQAYIHLDDAKKLVDFNQGVAGIRLSFTDVFASAATVRQVAITSNEAVYITDWTRSRGHLYNDIQMVKFITYIVLVLVIGVASFNIVSTLVMSVQDKESEIAILMTMGLTQARVMRIFIIQGMINAMMGCVLGGVSGYFISVNLSQIMTWIEQSLSVQFLSGDVYFIDFLPSEFQWHDLALLITSTLIISLVATIYPARKAATIQPANVLGQ